MSKADRVIWCDRGFFPVHYGFCPSEAAWKREVARLGAADEPYPLADARACVFDNRKTGSVAIIVTVDERLITSSAVATMALIAHESAHIWQAVLNKMGEGDPSPEFEAYALQDTILRLGAAYVQSRRPKWARK